MFRKKNSNSKTIFLYVNILIISSMSLTGCDKLPNIFDRKASTDTYKVKVPTTAPLEAGSSVTDSVIKNNQPKPSQSNVTLEPVEKNPKETSQRSLKKETNILLVDKPPSNKADSIVSGKITSGTPTATVQKALDALYYSSAKEAASYYHVNKKDFDKILAKMQPVFQDNTESVKIIKTSYSADKSSAIVDVLFKLKGGQEEASYQLKKLKGKWVIWID